MIEHNLDLIRAADWVIDLGPEAGDEGGQIVVQGTPEEVAMCPESHTGKALRDAVVSRAQNRIRAIPQHCRSRRKEAQEDLSKFPRKMKTTKLQGTDNASDSPDAILIQGAREHNLKNLSLAIPRNQFVVVTGVSGSGKSTLAFDLIFAEGQRRFLDSMNVYARQFVEQMSRPDVDLITGIPPTVSIEQRNSRGGGKSTVATVTEVYHFIRLLFAQLGTQYCPDCNVPVQAQTREAIRASLVRKPAAAARTRVLSLRW